MLATWEIETSNSKDLIQDEIYFPLVLRRSGVRFPSWAPAITVLVTVHDATEIHRRNPLIAVMVGIIGQKTSSTGQHTPYSIQMKLPTFAASALIVTSFLGITSRVDAATVDPILISPRASVNYVYGRDSLALNYNIPQTPSSGTVQIRWWLASDSNANITYRELVMDTSSGNVLTEDFNFIGPGADLLCSRQITKVETFIGGVKQLSTTSLPSGKYTFVLSYQNASLDPAASVRTFNVGLFETCGTGTSSASGYTPCTTTPTTTTTTSTTSTTSTTTNVPIVGTTTPSVTTTSTVATPNTVAFQAKTISKCSVKKGALISRKCLATNANIVISASLKMTIAISKASSKICKISGLSVRALKTGTCSTILSVTPKKGRTKTYKSKVVITN